MVVMSLLEGCRLWEKQGAPWNPAEPDWKREKYLKQVCIYAYFILISVFIYRWHFPHHFIPLLEDMVGTVYLGDRDRLKQ